MATLSKETESQSPTQCEPGCGCKDPRTVMLKSSDTHKHKMETEMKECCGPACACEEKPANTKLKAAICALVFAAVVGILLVKATACSSFVSATDKNASPQAIKQAGEPLASLAALATAAPTKDTVFVAIPLAGKDGVPQGMVQAIGEAKSALEAKGISVGVYTLNSAAPDYSTATAQQAVPAVMIINKGHGKEMVNGDVTQSRLLQAYVAASQASPVSGTGGAGSSGGGCGCNKGGGSGASTCGGGR